MKSQKTSIEPSPFLVQLRNLGQVGGVTLVGGKESKAVQASLEGLYPGEAHDVTAWAAACSAHVVRAPSKGHLDQVIIERGG